MNILVTGVSGFVGHHLAKELNEAGCTVFGLGTSPMQDEGLASLLDTYYLCDLTKKEEVAKLSLENMDAIINLAGLANVSDSHKYPDLYRRVNLEIVENLCERVDMLGLTKVRLIIVSTGTVYDALESPPFDEGTKLVPAERRNPYIDSKLSLEKCALDYREKGLDCIVVRPFNHIGPGQGLGFIVPDLAQQLKAASQAGQTEISVGDLSKERDYTDVRDVVKAYRLLATAPSSSLKQPIYNICTGKPYDGQELLRLLMQAMGLESIKVTVDPTRLRPHDPQSVFGDASKLTHDTGWRPEISLKQTIADFIQSIGV